MNKNKHIHFIGICGVAMSALAIALNKKGYQASGSDKGVYPPISTKLRKSDIQFYPGWHPNKMIKNGDPDLAVVGNVAGSNNPELKYIKEKNIDYQSYPEFIAENMIADNSLVCAGSYGKTSCTSLLAWTLNSSGHQPNYMFGGLAMNDNFHHGNINQNSEWSIIEGDEYKSARWDGQPKFQYYNPTHLLLSSVKWDHADIFPTQEEYKKAFLDLIKQVPGNGKKVLSQQAYKILKEDIPDQIITYGKNKQNDYYYTDLHQNKSGISFEIKHQGKSYSISSPMLGEYMAENITGCFAMATQIGIDPDQITSAVKSFQGLKRRLEQRLEGKVDVYDDIAHSPEKARATLKTISSIYTNKVIAVFEPNTGNRKNGAISQYEHALQDADEVIIPRLSKVKQKENDPNPPFGGEKLTKIISRTHNNVKHIKDDFELVDYLTTSSEPGGVIVFLGSHGFRKMIEMTVDALS